MWKFTFKQIFARKIRFLLTTFAVVIGVAFVVSTFALADSLRTTFDSLAGNITAGTDLTVRTAGSNASDFNQPTFDETVADQVAGVDGVAATAVQTGGLGFIIGADGEAIVPSGPPSFVANWTEPPGPQQFFLAEGKAPEGPDEFVVNVTAAEDNDLVIGESYEISGPLEQREFTLVGTVNFASPDNDDASIGAINSLFEEDVIQEFVGLEGEVFSVGIALEDGADEETVRAAVQTELGSDFQVVTQEELTEETADSFGEIVSIFNNVLLAFALITLFVAAFLVNNVFAIIVSQRVRELALLRAVGATSSQITRSIMGEALAVGIFSTVAGLGLGLLLAIGLQEVLNAVGFSLPPGPVELRLRTIIFATIVGVGVTILAALFPALRARQVPPVAAMRDGFQLTKGSLRNRLIRGGLITAIGLVLLMLGLFGSLDTAPLLTSVALGAVLIFLGVNGLAPAFAAPVAHALGRPIQAVFKLPGRLARENAARTPRRTASTAGALTIGLALVAMAAVIGDSIKSTFVETLDDAVESDYFIQPASQGFGPGSGFTGEVASTVREVDGVESIMRFRFTLGGIIVDGSGKNLSAADLEVIGDHIDPQVIEGDLDGLGAGDILVHKDPAEDLGLSVGDPLNVFFFESAQPQSLRVGAIYEDSTILDNWVVDIDKWDEQLNDRADAFVSVLTASDVEPDAIRADLDAAIEGFPTVKLEDRTEIKESTEQQLNSFLAVIFVFLVLALFIALIGITITLSLSVFERTRELGLLRAVGMTKVQMRRMVRWEAVIVALFGATLGVALGVLFGVAASQAIPETVIKNLSIPIGQLIAFFVIAAIAGIAAAIFPAYRASSMPILDAIADE